MANIASQEKRNRQNAGRRQRNKAVRTTLRTHMKQFRSAVDGGDPEAGRRAYQAAARQLDKAVGKGVVHRNYAANKKSQMARRLGSLS